MELRVLIRLGKNASCCNTLKNSVNLCSSNEREKLIKEVDEQLSLDFVIKSLRVAEKSTRPKAITLPDPKPKEVNGVKNVDNRK